MRVFIAVPIPEEISKYLREVQQKIKFFDQSAKLTYPDEFHMTLKFLGEVDDAKLESVKKALEKVPFIPFSVKLTKMGHFDEKELRVAWVGLMDTFEAILDLQKAVDKQLIYTFPKETKFHPHITLARIKHVEKPEIFIEHLNAIEIEPKNFSVNSFKLIKSSLSKDGASYETMGEYK